MLITRRLEFDAGHRIPDHRSQCRNLHGHRYVIEVTVEGPVLDEHGQSSNGMVIDFSDVKALTKEWVVDAWDHAFLAFKGDVAVIDFLASLPEHKTVILDCIPTAENLAREAFRILSVQLSDAYDGQLALHRVRLYETPNCWADAFGE